MSAAEKIQPTILNENDLVRQYTRMVRSIGLNLIRSLPASVSLDDLLQAGFMGLISAYRRYDGERGASFETYAGIRVRGAMLDELRSDATASRRVFKQLRDAAEITDQVEQSEGRSPKNREVATALGLGLEEYDQLMQNAATRFSVSLDQPANDSDLGIVESLRSEYEEPEYATEREEVADALAEATSRLPERERTALMLYLHRGLNLRETGEIMGVSESRVCQLHRSAIAKLRTALVDEAEVA